MSRYRKEKFDRRGRGERHRTNNYENNRDHHWRRDSEEYFSCNRDSLHHVGQASMREGPNVNAPIFASNQRMPYKDDFLRSPLPHLPNNGSSYSSNTHHPMDSRDSIFARLDQGHVMNRLGPVSYDNASMPPVPLFHSNESCSLMNEHDGQPTMVGWGCGDMPHSHSMHSSFHQLPQGFNHHDDFSNDQRSFLPETRGHAPLFDHTPHNIDATYRERHSSNVTTLSHREPLFGSAEPHSELHTRYEDGHSDGNMVRSGSPQSNFSVRNRSPLRYNSRMQWHHSPQELQLPSLRNTSPIPHRHRSPPPRHRSPSPLQQRRFTQHRSASLQRRSPLPRHRSPPLQHRSTRQRSPPQHGSPLPRLGSPSRLSKRQQLPPRSSRNRSSLRSESPRRNLSPRHRLSLHRERPAVHSRSLSGGKRSIPNRSKSPSPRKRSPLPLFIKRSPQDISYHNKASPRLEYPGTDSSIESAVLPYQVREVTETTKDFQNLPNNSLHDLLPPIASSLSITIPSSEFASSYSRVKSLQSICSSDNQSLEIPDNVMTSIQSEQDQCNDHHQDDDFAHHKLNTENCQDLYSSSRERKYEDKDGHRDRIDDFFPEPLKSFKSYTDWINKSPTTVIASSSSHGLLSNNIPLSVKATNSDNVINESDPESPCSTPRLTIDCTDITTENSIHTTLGVHNEPAKMDTQDSEDTANLNMSSSQGLGSLDQGGEDNPSSDCVIQSLVNICKSSEGLDLEEKMSIDCEKQSLDSISETLKDQSLMKKVLKESVELQCIDAIQPKDQNTDTIKESVDVEEVTGPESPESGEIVSDEETEEGEIEEISEEEKEVDSQPEVKELCDDDKMKKSIRNLSDLQFHRRQYPLSSYRSDHHFSRPYHREKGDDRRWPSRWHQHKTPRYEPDGKRKRHRSGSPKVEDEEKELLLLRNAALEAMIVRPKQPSKEPSPLPLEETIDQNLLEKDESNKDIVMEVDMDLVTSDSSPSSRDCTPDVSVVNVAAESIQSIKPLSKPVAVPANSSVKVVTNKNATWKIPSFKIVTTETDDEEDNDILKVIQMYRKVAEAKESDERIVSAMITELKECNEEIEAEEIKLHLLQQQLKVSEKKLVKLKERRIELEEKINGNSKLKQFVIPTVTIDEPITPSDGLSPIRSDNGHSVSSSKLDTSNTDDQPALLTFEDISQPSSVSHSPTPSYDVDQASDSDCKSENETGKAINTPPLAREISSRTVSSSSSSKPTSNIPVSGNKKKHLLNLVTARQNNLAQVKGLLAMLEHNQRKRKKSPGGGKQSISKKINKVKGTQSYSVHEHHLSGSNTAKTRPTSATGAKAGSQSSNAELQSIEIDSQAMVPLTETQPSDKKKAVLSQDSLQELRVGSIEEIKVKEWYDHMTSSDITSNITMPHAHLPLTFSAIGIVMNHFSNVTDKNVTTDDSSTITSSLDKALGNSNKPSNKAISSNHLSGHYESPLLKFRSYRLSPFYRTLSKKPLSSLTHSNTIRHDVIMCHHESQGKCSDKSCKAQHWSDVIMTQDDIINDLTQYLPSDQVASVRETISTTFGKLEKDQLQTMVAHIVNKELSHDDHVTISSQWLRGAVSKPTVKVPSKLKHNDLVSLPGIVEAPPSAIENKSDLDGFRYFNAQTKPATETTPTSIINNARQSANEKSGIEIIEKGIKAFPRDQTLWIEYIRVSHRSKESLQTVCEKAVSAVPYYSVYFEVIKLSIDKDKWILKALKHFLTIKEDNGCSQIVLELILSYCNWCLLTKDAKHVLEFLNFSDDIPENDVMSKLCIIDKIYLGLVHLHLMYTNTLPVTATGNDGCIPVRITSKKSFLIPFNHQKVPKELFDTIMMLFRCYIKRMTVSSCEVPVNVANCLPLYTNLFYFEVSQGNSRTTLISVSRLLKVVPNIKELLVFRSTLDSSFDIMKGVDPLLYYIKARNKLSQGDDVDCIVSLLTECVSNYFVTSEADKVDPCILYRKLLGYQVPYDLVLPPINDKLCLPDHTSLCLNYCLLVELTTPTFCDEVYESTLHHGTVLWLQYINLLAYRIKNNPSPQHFKQLLDVSQRFSLAVSSSRDYDYQLLYQSAQYADYTPHNQMLDILLECVHSYENKMKLLKHIPMHYNPYWIYRFYQFSEPFDEIRTIVASYLFKFPHNIDLWFIGISMEMRLGNFRQARWMFTKATQSVPHSKKLWTQFLLFELAGIVKQYSNLSLVQSTIDKLSVCGIEFKSSVLNLIKS